jgi:sirohydrochlorin cobaltochelatase
LSASDALLLIGHGSARYPDAGSAMHRHAERLRESNQFAQVEVALLNGTPSARDALARIEAPTIRVVPFFMEDGYFNRVAMPKALGIRQGDEAYRVPNADYTLDADPSKRIHICPPVGTHDAMAGLIERHAQTACNDRGLPSHTAAVLVVGHGSSSAPGQALALHRHTSRVAATELFARVEAACLEEPPFVAETLNLLRAHPVVIVGFFANHGGHVREDVPALVTAEQAARLNDPDCQAASDHTGLTVRFHGSITDDPMMVQIIMDQVGT